MAGYLNYRITTPNLTSLGILYEALPGSIVENVHLGIVQEVAKRAKTEMVSQIRKAFPLHSPGQKRPAHPDRPKRWQTPTHALANSVGVKELKRKDLRKKSLAIAYVGPRMDFKATKQVQERISRFKNFGLGSAVKPMFIPRGLRQQTVSPARYAHLALKGHGITPRAVAAGVGFRARPNDFMTPTIDAVNRILVSTVQQTYPTSFRKVMERDIRPVMRRLGMTTVSG